MKILKNIVVLFVTITIAVFATFVLRKYFFSFDKKLTTENKKTIEE